VSTVEVVERGQGTVEYLGLLAALAVLLGLLALAAASDPPQVPWASLIHLPWHHHVDTLDERALRDPLLGALIAATAPTIVLERDAYGVDSTVPSSDGCRSLGCAAFGRARCVLYVHVVHEPARLVLEYWLYYPTSQSDHLPIVALQGYHRDDWEGIEIALTPGGQLEGARASAHLGWNGSAPWWDELRDDWAPYAGVVYRAAGSHANGLRRGDIDLAGDSWNGDLGAVPSGSCELRAADRAGVRAREFDPGAVAPWVKQAWSDPGVEHTGVRGSSPGIAATAARAWAAALRVAQVGAEIERTAFP
jgi:hypothetical protein